MERKTTRKLKKVLKETTKVADEAYKDTRKFQKEVMGIFQQLNKNLDTYLESINVEENKNFEFPSVLKRIVHTIDVQSNVGMNDLQQSMKIKKEALNTFTISLFGRTKAGKSTIREALTKGSGETIGKGAQRTTRDVLEYSWNGLRILDVPGIEAYQGEEDTEKAKTIIDQSDMIIFLTTDDAVQPGEFNEMSQLQAINKHFIIAMNIKYNLMNRETNLPDERKINRLLRRPERVFNEERLLEHNNHIKNYVDTYFHSNSTEIFWIHAQAAFLSTLASVQDKSNDLWHISRMELLYEEIIREVEQNGKQRRILTFYDGLVLYLANMEKLILDEQKVLYQQIHFLIEKRDEIENYYKEFIPRSKRNIKNCVKQSFMKLKKWIPIFVEENMGRKNSKEEIEKYLEKELKKIDNTIEIQMQEITEELNDFLIEFAKRYQYDSEAVMFSDIDFENSKKDQLGRVVSWGGVLSGGVGTGILVVTAITTKTTFTASIVAAAGFGTFNIWNPIGWTALGVSAVAGLISGSVKKREKKKWEELKENAKESLLKNIEEIEQKVLKGCNHWFDEEIARKSQESILYQIDSFMQGLDDIRMFLDENVTDLGRIKQQLNHHLFIKLLQLEGVNCRQSDMMPMVREQGKMCKIIMPEKWKVSEFDKPNLSRVCGERVDLIIADTDLRVMIAKALGDEMVKPEDISFEVINNINTAFVQISNHTDEIPSIAPHIKATEILFNVTIKLI